MTFNLTIFGLTRLSLRGVAGVFGLGLCLTGCATYEPAPKGYSGATATLADSVINDGERCASFFYLESYNKHDVQNALEATQRRNAGRGMAMTRVEYSRQIPAMESTFHIVGRTHCAAPIVELSNSVYMIEGDVRFMPLNDAKYVISGELKDDHSAVWIQDAVTGKQFGNKLLIKGSTALNRGALLLLGPGAAKSTHKPDEIPPP